MGYNTSVESRHLLSMKANLINNDNGYPIYLKCSPQMVLDSITTKYRRYRVIVQLSAHVNIFVHFSVTVFPFSWVLTQPMVVTDHNYLGYPR